MKLLRQATFVILALPTFLLAFPLGVLAYGAVSGFNAGTDFMGRISK